MPVSNGRLIGAFFCLSFSPLILQASCLSSCQVLTPLLCCHKDSLCCEPLQQSWGSVPVKVPLLWAPQAPVVTVAAIAALLNYLGCWEGTLCHPWPAPELRAPKINPSPLPLGFLSVPWLVKSKSFTMASCCICSNTRRCFLVTWTLVSHRDKQMAFR